jgi:hypothetical protein
LIIYIEHEVGVSVDVTCLSICFQLQYDCMTVFYIFYTNSCFGTSNCTIRFNLILVSCYELYQLRTIWSRFSQLDFDQTHLTNHTCAYACVYALSVQYRSLTDLAPGVDVSPLFTGVNEMERYWNCKQLKRGVTLCSSDDRLCPECYAENEKQLQLQHTKTTAEAAAGPSGTSEAAKGGKQPGNKTGKKPNKRNVAGESKESDERISNTQSKSAQEDDHAVNDNIQITMPCCPLTFMSSDSEIASLRAEVCQQKAIINELQQRLNALLIFLGITEQDAMTTNPARSDHNDKLTTLQCPLVPLPPSSTQQATASRRSSCSHCSMPRTSDRLVTASQSLLLCMRTKPKRNVVKPA